MNDWDEFYSHSPIFRKHADGRITVDEWPERIIMCDEFLAQADPQFVSIGDGIVSFNADPPASYGLVGHDFSRLWTYGVKSPSPVLTEET